MTQDSTHYTLTLEPDFDEFDPLEDSEEIEEPVEGAEDIVAAAHATDAFALDDTAAAPVIDNRPAEERIAELFSEMAPRRKVLLGILSYCREAQPVAEVNEHINHLQENNFSVYTAADLCSLLERAGALDRLTADGRPAEEAIAEPETVVIDGVEYLQAAEPAVLYWRTTNAGLEAVEADKPLERLHELLESDSTYLPIYRTVLSLCAAEGGAAMDDINEALNDDPLLQEPRLFASHFVDGLEACDAIAWNKTWKTTDIGTTGLALLSNVADEKE